MILRRPVLLILAAVLVAPPVSFPAQAAQEEGRFEELLPVEEFSPTILGIYRKVMEIEEEIRRHSDRYGVDYDLARATCMYESGGNANLTSWAGAEGYFQVMSGTFRMLGVDTNIEAGIKYIGQLVREFEREDYALAAYNGGPGTVSRGRPMRLESLQYVLGVGHYRTMLKLHETSIRHHASRLQLAEVGPDDDWWSVSRRLDLPLLQLRLHNPYLARRQLRPGQLIVYPREPRQDLFEASGDHLVYVTRRGDNYFNLAFTLDVDLDELRSENSLWHLQTLPTGMHLRLPLAWEGEYVVHRVQEGDSVDAIAEQHASEPWRILRDNALLLDEELTPGMLLRVREVPRRPRYIVHEVRRGENLTSIASRYGTSIAAIQAANGLGRGTLIRIGDRLRVPAAE